jgi:CPA2 family monovalent cation:H+ antiporter-2
MHNLPELLAAGLLLTAFFGVSFLSQKFKLPSVLLFIILGMVFMSLLAENAVVHLLAEIGIILLFFILGLEFPVSKILTISKSIWPAGIMDIGLNLGVPILVALILKLNCLPLL